MELQLEELEVQDRLDELVEQLEIGNLDRVIILRNGKPAVKLIPIEKAQ